MKALLLIPVFLLSLAFAQDESSNWFIGVQGGAGHTFRTLDPTTEDAAFVAQIRDSLESPITGYNGGIVFGRRLFKNLWLESGLQLSVLGHVTNTSNDSSVIPIPLPITPPLVGDIQTFNRFYHLNIPLLLKLYTNQGKLRGFLLYGPQINISIAERSRVIFSSTNNESIAAGDLVANFNSMVMSLVGGAGLSFNPTEKFSIELRGFARRDITPIADEPIRQQPFYVAGNLGVGFHF